VAPDRDSLDPEAARHQADPEEGNDQVDSHDAVDEETDEFPDFTDLGDPESPSPPPGKMEAWRKRSATGAVLTGLALGFQQVFEKEREEPAIIMTTSGDPPRDLPVEAEVEHGRPRRSVVNIRPWLLDRGGERAGAEPATGATGATNTGTAADAATDTRTSRDEPPTGAQPEGD
jgi:hypothetical protein